MSGWLSNEELAAQAALQELEYRGNWHHWWGSYYGAGDLLWGDRGKRNGRSMGLACSQLAAVSVVCQSKWERVSVMLRQYPFHLKV